MILLIHHIIHSQEKFSINQLQLELQDKMSTLDVKLTIKELKLLLLLYLLFFKEMKPKLEGQFLNLTRIQKYSFILLITEHQDSLQCQLDHIFMLINCILPSNTWTLIRCTKKWLYILKHVSLAQCLRTFLKIIWTSMLFQLLTLKKVHGEHTVHQMTKLMENQSVHALEISSQSTGWKIQIKQKWALKLFLINSQQYRQRLIFHTFFNGEQQHLIQSQLEISKLEMLMEPNQIYGKFSKNQERKSWKKQSNGIVLKFKEKINLLLIQEMLLSICYTTESLKIHH